MKIFDYYKRCNGSISLFLAMIILLVISLVLTSLEGVRIKSSYARCNEITYVAVDSCFSKYGREIFEDYGLMMLWQDEDAFISEYEGYVDKNCNYKKDILYNSVDLLSLRQENAELVNKTMATDEDGELIENQICEYMKAALTEDLINQILANNQALSQNDGINVFNEKLEECGDYINEAEASVEKIYDNIDVVKAGYNPSELIENMKLKLEEIKELPPESDNAVRNSLYIQYRAELKKYQQWEGEVNEALLQVLNSTNDYLVNTTSAINEVNNLKSSINAEKDNYQKYIFDTMEEELEDINNNILSLENDNYNVSNNKQYTIEQKKIVNLVKEDMEYSIAKALDIESDNKYISDYQDYTDIIDNMYTDIIKAQSDIQGYDAESLGVNYTKKGGSKKKNEIVDFMDKIKDNGVIGYVVAGDMSDKSTSLEGLPSNISGGYSTDNWKKYDTYNDCVRRVLVGQYIFDKFESYTDGNTDGILDYEIEYIIGGKSSDKDNLSEVIDKLIIIREGFNYIFLLRDSKKREEAYLMATAIVGFTGLPAMVRLTQFLIIGAWAYGESIIDVKDLLEGYRVNILKQSDEWNLELSDFGNLSSTDSEKGNRTGLAYEDYLRFMLFNQDRAKQIYRIMDMIQINLCAEYNSSFRISECIIGVRVCSEYAIKRMFSDIGIVSDIIRNKKKRFIIDVECQYSY